MTDQELKDLVASLAVKSDRLDAQLAETWAQIAQTNAQHEQAWAQLQWNSEKTDVQLAETSRKLDKVGDMIGTFGRNLGDITEEFFFNSLAQTQNLAGIHYDFIDKNLTRKAGKVEDEFDIVMVNGKDVAIIEVKYKAHEADLTKLLTKKYDNFKKLFPMYKDYTHHLVLATFSLYDDLKEKALANGVIVLQRKGDMIESFVPS
jgi:Holliday junction resolvase-like predicted endonuclease